MNKINPRTESNSKLLQLLSNRSSNKLLKHNENQWPGKQKPSFASSLPLKQSQSQSQIQVSSRKKSEVLPGYKKANEIISSSRSLSLIPKTDRKKSGKSKSLTGHT